MGIRRDDPPEDRKRSLMRSAATASTYKFSHGGREKEGHRLPRTPSMPKMPWNDEPKDKE